MQKLQLKITSSHIQQFGEYLYERENADATIRKYITDVHTFVSFLDADTMVDKKRVRKYKEWLCENYAMSSVNSMLIAINQFLEYLGISHMKVKRLKIQKNIFLSDEKEMSREEYYRLLDAAKKKKKPQLVMAMQTLAVTGARISELSFFTIEKVKSGKVEIFNKGKHRTILISDTLRKKILYFASKHGISHGPIFVTRTGKTKNRSNLWKEMKNLNALAKVESSKIFPHNLRHLFAKLYYKMTKDLAGLADLLGHNSLDVTRIYTATSGNLYKQRIEGLGLLKT